MPGQWDITGWQEELIEKHKDQSLLPTQADFYLSRGPKSLTVPLTNGEKLKRDTLLLHAAGWCPDYIVKQLLHYSKDYGPELTYAKIYELVIEITKGVQSDPEHNHFQNIFQINQGYIRRWEP